MDKNKLNEDQIIGEKIRQIRVVKRISQDELGKHLGLAKQTISKIEKGNRKVTATELLKISEYFEKYINEFLKSKILPEKHEENNIYQKMVKQDIVQKKPIDTDFIKFINEMATRTGYGGFSSYIKDYLKKKGLSEEEVNKIWKETHSYGEKE